MFYMQVIFFLGLSLAIIYLYTNLKRTRKEVVHMDSPTLSREDLLQYASDISKKHFIYKGYNSINFLLTRMDENYKYIAVIYKKLNVYINKKCRIPDAAEWLLDNFYIIEKQTKELRLSVQKKYFKRLPVMKTGAYRGYPRVFALTHELVSHTDSVVEQDMLIDFILEYQKTLKLSDAEIWSLETMIRIALIENIRRLCENIMDTQIQYDKANELADILWAVRDDKHRLKEIISEHFRFFDITRSPFFECLVRLLRKKGNESRIIFAGIDNRLSDMNLSSDDIVQIEHQKQAGRHISIGNAITSLRFILNLDFTEIFERLSIVEQMLSCDPLGVYNHMDKGSKNYYRRMVERLARKFDISEVEVAKSAVELAKEYEGGNEKKKHVGYYLIKNELSLERRPGLKSKKAIYIMSIIILTGILCAGLGYYSYLSINMNVFITALVIAFAIIPVSDIVINVMNYILTRCIKTTMIPKLELSDGIPDNGKTLIVISTLLTSEKNVGELAEKIEIYKTANDDKNLYFGILSDFPDSYEEINEQDEKNLAAMEYEINKLNKKYGNFYLFHRKRTYHHKDKKYMGKERKRGALSELNSFLVSGRVGSFCSIIGNRTELADIKYVITLDADTRLTLGSAKKLIGTMLHPINNPEIDPNKRKVVDGYGLLQPKITMDINSANMSLFSKIFAGQGGLDTYSNAVSDVYQDLFNEGIYTGKGIYDVSVFEKVLGDSIPENTVLSHDLLEGCYVRCGLVSDVELIDGFPYRYNSYSMRGHRWMRGDWQIMRWLFPYVKNAKGKKVKNHLCSMSRWKIFDNLRRSLLNISLLLLVWMSFSANLNIAWWWLSVCVVAISSSLLVSTVDWFISGGYLYTGQRYHSTIIYGLQGVLYQVALMIIFLPYEAYLAADSIIRTIYRVLFSHKKMLEWTTAEESERKLKNDISGFYRRMIFNVLCGAIIMTAAQNKIISSYVLGVLWILGPYIAYAISIPQNKEKPKIKQTDREYLVSLAKQMWTYFDDFSTVKDNYLPPDNFQENPPNGIAHRTSPTNIGMLLIACLSAYDFGFINIEKMLDKLEQTIGTIKKLDKWNGHLYNWYNTQTLDTLRPRYISTVDNGNYIVYLITLKEGLTKIKPENDIIQSRIDTIAEWLDETVKNTKFRLLYDNKRKLFTIGYNCEEERLTRSYYDLLGSEARQVSYVAIATGEIEKEHWFELGRTLTTSDSFRGLVSWTGTMFEYLMPLLVMKNVPNTLLDETYKFVIYCQKKYGRQRKVPWGTSESGFNAFDINLNYQYKAFGVPELGLKRGLVTDMVVAPYATIMGLMVDGEGTMKNINRLKGMNITGKYGFYEAVDYTPERVPYNEEYGVVNSYMVHHLGMSLLAVDNYLNDNIMQKRFHSNINIKAAQELLEERIPTRVIITKDNKQEVLPLEPIETPEDEVIRSIENVNVNAPNVHVLSNGRYSTVLTDSGLGYARCKNHLRTRFRKDMVNGIYGTFIYITDVNSQTKWSASYAPLFKDADDYRVIFKPHMAEYFRRDGNIETHTEVVVSAEHDCEIRNVNITNRSDEDMFIDVTSYMEVTLTSYAADVAHMAFSNLFVRTEFDKERNAVVVSRRPRMGEDGHCYSAHGVSVDGETVGEIEYETDRVKFVGRNRNVINPAALDVGSQLSRTVGAVLDPIISLKVRVKIEAGKTARIAFTTSCAENREEALEAVDRYNNQTAVARCIEMAHMRSKTENKYLGFDAAEQECYLKMLPHILFLTSKHEEQEQYILNNEKGQETLWSYGISGDNPIITLVVNGKNLDIIRQVLNAHEFLRIKGIIVDLVIISEGEGSYIQPVKHAVYEIVSVSHARELLNVSGGVFLIQSKSMHQEDKNLLFATAHLVLTDEKAHIKDQIETKKQIQFKSENKFSSHVKEYENQSIDIGQPEFFNGFGGFINNEYLIKLKSGENTPLPWVNVISNERFGIIATETGGGYVWAENSREMKLTPWCNDSVSDFQGESIYINDNETGKVFCVTRAPMCDEGEYVIKHGFGYTEYSHISQGIEQTQTVFVAKNDSVKITLLKLKNTSDTERDLTITHYLRPVMGVSDEYTAKYIVTSVHQNGTIFIKNSYNKEFPDRVMFVGASIASTDFTCDRREFFGKSMAAQIPEGIRKKTLSKRTGAGVDPCVAQRFNVPLAPREEKEITILTGQEMNEQRASALCKQYEDVSAARRELDNIKKYWNQKVAQIEVKTPERAMDIMLNGWMLYQTLSCRIMGRSAFYQSGGAYGFRDQLQDVLSLIHAAPELIRKQLILHASHQFEEGDVQHWWHVGGDTNTNANKGVRTKFSDDLLWLPYVTAEYVKTTGDDSILREVTPFIRGEVLPEKVDERYFVPEKSDKEASVYEHCVLAIEKSLKFGERGLPLMGSGDWNDGMSLVGNKGKGESVWMGWFLIDILNKFSYICELSEDNERADRYRETAVTINNSIEKNAWDGSWYRRAYFDDGTPLGSNINGECKIDSISQTWAIISKAGDRERIKTAMSNLETNLINKEAGIIKLLTPPFDGGELKPGYIKGYVPGVRENGGQYTHAACWTVLAYAMMGNGDKAMELYNMINPINHTRTGIEVATYKAEPYVIAADVYSSPPHVGRGGWSWYTGASGWFYRVGIENILGVKKYGDKLVIAPCIPKKWEGYSLKYNWKDTTYNISVNNPNQKNELSTPFEVELQENKGNLYIDIVLNK